MRRLYSPLVLVAIVAALLVIAPGPAEATIPLQVRYVYYPPGYPAPPRYVVPAPRVPYYPPVRAYYPPAYPVPPVRYYYGPYYPAPSYGVYYRYGPIGYPPPRPYVRYWIRW